MSDLESGRRYSPDELKAMRRLSRVRRVPVDAPVEGQGFAYWAAGPYYPDLLEKFARDYAKAAKDAALVAAALRREFDRWPEK